MQNAITNCGMIRAETRTGRLVAVEWCGQPLDESC
jgi:hypothetical protein